MQNNRIKFKLNKDMITLGQLLKVLSFVESGGLVKMFLEENKSDIFVNNVEDNRRGRKLYKGDIVKVLDTIIEIE